jgi:hypothetical protein
MERWDPDTFEVALDFLAEALDKPDFKEAGRVAAKITLALHQGDEPGENLERIWANLDWATRVDARGVGTTLVLALYEYARKHDDLAMFERLLRHPATAGLRRSNVSHALPESFIELAARTGLRAEPGLRFTLVHLLGQCSTFEPARDDAALEFIVSCLGDAPLDRQTDASSHAAWLLAKVLSQPNAPQKWLDRVEQIAGDPPPSGLAATEIMTALAAQRADARKLELLLGTTGARLEAALAGLERAAASLKIPARERRRGQMDESWEALERIVQPLLSRTKLSKKARALVDELFPAPPTLDALIASLSAARPEPRYRHTLNLELGSLIRNKPALRHELPDPFELEAPLKYEISKELLLGMFLDADWESMQTFLARGDARMRHQAAFLCANGRTHEKKSQHAATATLIAPLLGDPDPSVRWGAVYFFTQYAADAAHDLEPWATEIVALLLDDAKGGGKETVSEQARRAVTLAATNRAKPMISAAKVLLEGPERAALRRILKQILPQALE